MGLRGDTYAETEGRLHSVLRGRYCWKRERETQQARWDNVMSVRGPSVVPDDSGGTGWLVHVRKWSEYSLHIDSDGFERCLSGTVVDAYV